VLYSHLSFPTALIPMSRTHLMNQRMRLDK